MLEIEKSPSADSRTAKGNVSKEDLLKSSQMHISDVRQACNFFADMLRDAGEKHDWSKIEYIDEFYRDFSKGLKGDEFKKAGWFQKHIQERHHLTDRCPDDVNLIDVLERISDIVMAGMARSGEVYDDTLSNEILQKAFKNTVELLKKQVVVHDTEDIFSTPIEK